MPIPTLASSPDLETYKTLVNFVSLFPVKKLNVDYTPDATTKYGIKSVPTVILVENEQEKEFES